MVEWKTIDDISKNVFAGGTPSTKHEEYYDGDIPWIRSGEIDFNTITKAERNITKEGYNNSSAKLIRSGSVVMAMTGATVAKSAIVEFETSANQSVCAIETDESVANYKYVYFYLSKDYFKIKSSAQGALTSLNLSMIKQIEIPIPSLEEQNRIVGILDTFTSAIDNLKEQIAQRRKQYEYYRDQLLDLEGKPGVEMNNVAHFVKERILANELTAHNYTSVENLLKDKAGRKDAENVPSEGNWTRYQKGDVLIGNIRPYLRKIWLSDREGGTNGDVIVIRSNDTLLPEFMFYCLASDSFFLYYNQALKDGKMPRGEKKRVLSYVIPSVGKEEQQRIVSILDTFEASIQNLEAQLKQREKQYEYYRNKLLTFE